MPPFLMTDAMFGTAAALFLNSAAFWFPAWSDLLRRASASVAFAASVAFLCVCALGIATGSFPLNPVIATGTVPAVACVAIGAYGAVIGEWPCTAGQGGLAIGGLSLTVAAIAIPALPPSDAPRPFHLLLTEIQFSLLFAGIGLATAVNSIALWRPGRAVAARRAAGLVLCLFGVGVLGVSAVNHIATGDFTPLGWIGCILAAFGAYTGCRGLWPWYRFA
jgi:hypothetical protein